MEKYIPKYSICVGPSMYPTLRSIDNIITEKYEKNDDIRVGDIIVYPHPDKTFDVVHRIIKIMDAGVITRGDNNNKIDPYVVRFADIKGKIIAIRRGKKSINIAGGIAGYIIHKIMLIRKYAVFYYKVPISKLSAVIANSKLFNFLDPLFKVKIVYVNGKNGVNREILKLGTRAIGKRYGRNSEWFIKFPYKFFIKKERLK